jgi:hypothetical protein
VLDRQGGSAKREHRRQRPNSRRKEVKSTYTIESSEIFCRVKDNGVAVINIEQLLQIKDLDMMIV